MGLQKVFTSDIINKYEIIGMTNQKYKFDNEVVMFYLVTDSNRFIRLALKLTNQKQENRVQFLEEIDLTSTTQTCDLSTMQFKGMEIISDIILVKYSQCILPIPLQNCARYHNCASVCEAEPQCSYNHDKSKCEKAKNILWKTASPPKILSCQKDFDDFDSIFGLENSQDSQSYWTEYEVLPDANDDLVETSSELVSTAEKSNQITLNSQATEKMLPLASKNFLLSLSSTQKQSIKNEICSSNDENNQFNDNDQATKLISSARPTYTNREIFQNILILLLVGFITFICGVASADYFSCIRLNFKDHQNNNNNNQKKLDSSNMKLGSQRSKSSSDSQNDG